MSRDSRIAEDPGKHFSATGNARKLEIWILFSDRDDPNPKPNVGSYFGDELRALWQPETYKRGKSSTSSRVEFQVSKSAHRRRRAIVSSQHWRDSSGQSDVITTDPYAVVNRGRSRPA